MVKLTEFELGYLVGVLEGEGHFSGGKQLGIWVPMTDFEVPKLLCQVTGVGKLRVRQAKKRDGQPAKDQLLWVVTKAEDVVWLMKTVRPFMSSRRQSQIDEAFRKFQGHLDSRKVVTKKGVPLDILTRP